MVTVSQKLWYGYARRFIKCTIPADIMGCMMGYFDTTLIWTFPITQLKAMKKTRDGLYYASKPIMLHDILFQCLFYPSGHRKKNYSHLCIKIHRMPPTICNCTIFYQYKLNQQLWHRGTAILNKNDRHSSDKSFAKGWRFNRQEMKITVILDLLHVQYYKQYKLNDYHQMLHTNRRIKHLWNINFNTNTIYDGMESDTFGCWCLVMDIDMNQDKFGIKLKLLKLPKDIRELIVEYKITAIGGLQKREKSENVSDDETKYFAFSRQIIESMPIEYKPRNIRGPITFCVELQIRKIDRYALY